MFAVCDIGATTTRVAVASLFSQFQEPQIYPTPKDFEHGIAELTIRIQDMADGEKIEACVVGVAGSLLPNKSGVFASFLTDWEGRDIKDAIAAVLDCDVTVENDAALVGLGEAVFGAGRQEGIVAYLTISTGVGGALIVNQQIAPNVYGFEPGLQLISTDGMVQDIDSYISGTALQRIHGKHPRDITDPAVWDEVARVLSYAVFNTMMYWSPDIVILGGGLMVHNAIDINLVRANMTELMQRNDNLEAFAEFPPVVKAQLGDFGGLYGGLAYLQNF